MLRLATCFCLIASPTFAADVDFDRDIRPILSDKCAHCHGPDANTREADLRLDTREGLFAKRDGIAPVVPHRPKQSELIRRIASTDPDEQMPPGDSKLSLSKKQIALLTAWVESGAEWRGHWAFDPPTKPTPPEVNDKTWPKTDFDRFILEKLESELLKPQPEASKEALIRRVTLDLTGLPPTIAEIDAFLADKSKDAYRKVVERLLKSDSYGERMAWDWLDAARYADTNGYQGDRERTMWPWRDWVIESLNNNMPFDDFTVWQLAGDLLPEATEQQKLATGFCRNHMINGEGGRIAEENRIEYVFDQTETMATVWMGLTMTCSRCHDHKFDPISKKEYFQMFAFFNRTPVNGGGGDPAMAPNMQITPASTKLRIAEMQKKIATANRTISSRRAALTGQQDAWEKQFASKAKWPLWSELAPSSMTSQNGQDLKTLDDGSIFVSGKNPATDTYTIKAPSRIKTITAVKLDGIRHESFTRGGIARSDSGNFVLTGFELQVTRGDKSTSVEIASAKANHEQKGHPIANVLNDNQSNGWAVLKSKWDSDVAGIFYLADPIENADGTQLTITMKHNSPHAAHNVGRFRLSVTDKPAVKLGEKDDAFLAAIGVPRIDRTPAQKKVVAERFQNSDTELRKQNDSLKKLNEQIGNLRKNNPRVMIMQDVANYRKTHMLTRGSYNKLEGEVTTALPSILPKLERADDPNRLDLAQWLVDKKHPLTARVTANRIWQQFFGTGLVKTTEDFGVQGEKPSHPKLLDWLAVEFVESGWDVKAMHRLIVTSATYRQQAAISKDALAKDPANRLLSRGPRFRLPSWMIRDVGLAASGLLVDRVGGPPVQPYQPEGVWAEATFGKKRYKQDTGEKLYRRSLYTFWRRIVGPTMFFDVAKRQTCSVRTGRTNTPLHALTTLNDITFVEIARALAERVLEAEGEPNKQIELAFRLATSRRPKPQEAAILSSRLKMLEKEFKANPEEAAKLLKMGESPTNERLDAAKHAAMTGLCQLILNLDEALSN